jgi:hypothetical protein
LYGNQWKKYVAGETGVLGENLLNETQICPLMVSIDVYITVIMGTMNAFRDKRIMWGPEELSPYNDGLQDGKPVFDLSRARDFSLSLGVHIGSGGNISSYPMDIMA